jgi:hypothetical protein
VQAQSTTLGLIQPQDFVYEGAFRLPDGGTDQTTFRYGGSALQFDPYRQSLWAVGHDHYQQIAEISIPTPVNSMNLGSLPRATIRTPWIDTTDRLHDRITF